MFNARAVAENIAVVLRQCALNVLPFESRHGQQLRVFDRFLDGLLARLLVQRRQNRLDVRRLRQIVVRAPSFTACTAVAMLA